MAVINVPMKEFLLWSNCPNNCQFCWQKKLNKPETLLTDEEKVQSIEAVMSEIDTLGYTDILIVGGEVYCPQSETVKNKLKQLFDMIISRIKEDKTRLLYINTNLLYEDLSFLEYIMYQLNVENEERKRLRFTTSFDIAGRFADDNAKTLFMNNLKYMTSAHWGVSVAVNMIMTKPFCQAIINKDFIISEFTAECHPAYINTIPYIPLGDLDPLKPTQHEILTALRTIEEDEPHYLRYYIDQYDSQQDRTLKEYRKGEGLIECSSSYLECGHNSNYTKVLDSKECFICMIKEELANDTSLRRLDDESLQRFVDEGRYIITIGDVCTKYVWDNFRQPDYMVIDGESNGDESRDIVRRIKAEGLPRKLIINESNIAEPELEDYLGRTLHNEPNHIVQVVGEEDGAFMVCMRKVQPGDILIAGDSHRKCMIYYTTDE